MRHLTLFLFFIPIFFCCKEKEKEKYPYKVDDFKPEHRSNLIRINYFGMNRNPLLDPFYPDSFSKAELIKLFNCNNPYIRVNAFFALVERKDSSIYPLLINYLDATSKIKWWA